MKSKESLESRVDSVVASSKAGFKYHTFSNGSVSQIELHLFGPLADLSEPLGRVELGTTNIIDLLGRRKKLPSLRAPLSIKTKAEAISKALRGAQRVQGENLPTLRDEEVLIIVKLAKSVIEYNALHIPVMLGGVLAALGVCQPRRCEFIVQRKGEYPTYEAHSDWTSIYISPKHGIRRLLEENTEQLLNWGRKPYLLVG